MANFEKISIDNMKFILDSLSEPHVVAIEETGDTLAKKYKKSCKTIDNNVDGLTPAQIRSAALALAAGVSTFGPGILAMPGVLASGLAVAGLLEDAEEFKKAYEDAGKQGKEFVEIVQDLRAAESTNNSPF